MENNEKLQVILEQAKSIFTELNSNKHCALTDIPKQQGVYLIYDKHGNVMYVGKAKNLHRRINSDHISGETKISTSTFRRQLVKRLGLVAGKDLRKWITDNCLFSYIEISDPDLCDMVESLTILVLRSNGSKLLNHLVE